MLVASLPKEVISHKNPSKRGKVTQVPALPKVLISERVTLIESARKKM